MSAKSRKRGNSFGRFINKMIGGANKSIDEEITTEHGFELKTQNKTFTLFTFNMEEAETWVRVLSLVVEMNYKGISVDKVNPFDYEKFKKCQETPQQKNYETES